MRQPGFPSLSTAEVTSEILCVPIGDTKRRRPGKEHRASCPQWGHSRPLIPRVDYQMGKTSVQACSRLFPFPPLRSNRKLTFKYQFEDSSPTSPSEQPAIWLISDRLMDVRLLCHVVALSVSKRSVALYTEFAWAAPVRAPARTRTSAKARRRAHPIEQAGHCQRARRSIGSWQTGRRQRAYASSR